MYGNINTRTLGYLPEPYETSTTKIKTGKNISYTFLLVKEQLRAYNKPRLSGFLYCATLNIHKPLFRSGGVLC